MRSRTVFLCLLLVTGPIRAADPHFDGKSWWATVSVLADDKFEGRNTGSPGARAAQDYLVGQLRALGIRPAGTQGYFQPIELKSRTIDEAQSSIVLIRDVTSSP